MGSAKSILQEKVEPRSQPPWWRVIVTPWVDIFRPRTAAAHMVAASPWAFWITFSLHGLLLTAVVLWLALWADTVEAHWSETPVETSAQNPGDATDWTRQVYERTYTEVWDDWCDTGTANPATFVLFFIPVLLVVCTSFGAWLHLITVHTAGSVWKSYQQSWRAIASCSGLLLLFTFGLGSGIVGSANLRELGSTQRSEHALMLLMPAIPAAACFLVAWIGGGVRAIRAPVPDVHLQPRCEGCGYDLTHVPDDGLCPECGLDTASSLTPESRRPGCPWENQRGMRSWLETSAYALTRPSEFYSKLQLRTGKDHLHAYSRWHFVGVGCGAAVWISIAMSATDVSGPTGGELLAMSSIIGFLTTFLGWVIHRTVGAVASSWWLARGLLADFSWARKVLIYETVFLWVFCLYNGVLISSFLVFDLWISSSAASRVINNVFQMPGEAAAIIFGNLALGLLWLWRYRIAVRAIRWSNF